MKNIVDYAGYTRAEFEKQPLNAVDSLILSQLSYYHFPIKASSVLTREGAKLCDLPAVCDYDKMLFDVWNPKLSRELFEIMVANPRYKNIIVKGYEESTNAKDEKQFSAVTFQLSEDAFYVAFRGTDSSLIGWKENFNMAYQLPVPSQTEAVGYLETAAQNCRGKIYVGGHSKGGNLAVYASAFASDEVKKRICKIYSHDGPGFLTDVTNRDEYKSIERLIDKTVPQSSLVGMLLDDPSTFKVVKSSRIGVLQHEPFSWQVKDDEFLYLSKLTGVARYNDKTLNAWINSLSNEERRRLVNLIFDFLEKQDVFTTFQLKESWQKSVLIALSGTSKTDKDAKKFFKKSVKRLVSIGIKNIPELFRNK